MYFLSVAFFIHLRAKKDNIKPIPKDELPKFKDVIKEGWNFFIPIAVLVGFLMKGFTPTFSASLGILSIIISSWLNKNTRMSLKDIIDALALRWEKYGYHRCYFAMFRHCSRCCLMVGMGIKFSMIDYNNSWW